MRWATGDTVVRRSIWFGQVTNAKPLTVVDDRDDVVALYLSPGTRFKIGGTPGRRYEYIRELASRRPIAQDDVWVRTRALVLSQSDAAHSIWAFWPEAGGELLSWYVNLERPQTRSWIGFDTADLFLDIVVDPDLRSWRWKDEDELAEAQRLSLVTEDEAQAVRAEGERVTRLIDNGDAWWTKWRAWAPDPSWPIPMLPEGWQKV